MKITMRNAVAGPGLYLARNQHYDLPTAKAQELIAARFAIAASPTHQPSERKPHAPLQKLDKDHRCSTIS